MSALTAAEIAAFCDGTVVGDRDARADSWTFDSRVVESGACFVALRDSRDGHDFVENALAAGARVALVDRELPGLELAAGTALVRTGDALTGLQAVARNVRAGRTDLDVVAVAGSTGKTSTKDLLAAVLASHGCHANAESFNNEFGLPITLLNAPLAARIVVTEMGERFPGDLAVLCEIARPQVGVVTNVGLAHAEFLGGAEGAAAVLGELLDALPSDGIAVLNADDPWSAKLAALTSATALMVGRAPDADYRITDESVDDYLHATFTLVGSQLPPTEFTLTLHGAHHISNAAQALAVAHRMYDTPASELVAALAATRPGRWRMELSETSNGVTVLNDAYNANPTSMDAALVALAGLPVTGRRIAVLGDMRELGAHHDGAHRTVGERVAALGIHELIAVGPGGALIAAAAGEHGASTRLAADAAAATTLVVAETRAGDAVLIKGSRAVGLERVATALLDTTGKGGTQ